jgi:hypothetical protein
MTKELVDKLLALGIVEKVSEQEIQQIDLSEPVMLLKLADGFLVILYHSKTPHTDIPHHERSIESEGNNIGELKGDIRKALNYWLKEKPRLGRQYEFAAQAVQNQIDSAVDILFRCFQDMYRKVQKESLGDINKK